MVDENDTNQTEQNPSDRPRRALVTGGSGFIGSHLVEHLLKNNTQVCVIDNLSTGRISNLASVIDQIEFIEADVDQGLEQINDDQPFDEIYHLAAAVGVDLVLSDPIRSIKTNIHQTDAVFEYALEHGSPATLIASSSEVYGKPGTSVFSEDDDLLFGPTSITRWSYAHAKAIDEHLALAYWHKHQLPTVICRFFNTVGPRQIGRYGMVLPRFVQAAMKNEPLSVFGDGTQTRCFCDGRDVIQALPQMIRSQECVGRVFNIGSDHPISIMDLAQSVIETLNSTSQIKLVAYSDAYQPGFEDLRHRKPDLDRVRSAINFEPKLSLTETIQDLAFEIQRDSVQGGV
ncbi:MAG: GDP-mannose 4,6-dehydratase [Phycisphaerales bacterium]|nr:GDP-mannose 4,6-dehydratase [Phycisphaerales bacterium]